MSTYFQVNGAPLSVCPDPDGYQDRGIAVVGKFVNGGVIRQGRGGGTYRWRVLTQAEYADLYSTWDANKDGRAACTFPPTSGASLTEWQAGYANLYEPLRGRIEDGLCFDVRMDIDEIGS